VPSGTPPDQGLDEVAERLATRSLSQVTDAGGAVRQELQRRSGSSTYWEKKKDAELRVRAAQFVSQRPTPRR